jgi:signal transduction histidine kinase
MDVADRGPGLTVEEKTKAFEKFYRGPHRRRDGTHGAGLGLAICAAIARLHGGRLDVEDREGGGARFILSLPCEEQPPAIEALDMHNGEVAEQP